MLVTYVGVAAILRVEEFSYILVTLREIKMRKGRADEASS